MLWRRISEVVGPMGTVGSKRRGRSSLFLVPARQPSDDPACARQQAVAGAGLVMQQVERRSAPRRDAHPLCPRLLVITRRLIP